MGNGTGTILIAGNSFALWHWKTLQQAMNWKFRKADLFSRGVCLLFTDLNVKDERFDCDKSRDHFVNILERIKPDMLIIDQKLSLNYHLRLPITEPDNATQIIIDSFKLFSNFTQKIVIIEPNFSIENKHQIPAQVFSKIYPRKPSILNWTISIKEIEAEMDPSWKRIQKAVESCPKCELLPTRQQFCGRDGTTKKQKCHCSVTMPI
uniref:SGNH domain-containing protein n=1 Tax=Panagrolaimus sp. JU765 TaxID=591449 RepID=A0AC34Q1V8_9BILA